MLLDYPAQCAELEKMARRGAPQAALTAPPALGRPAPGRACLVCGARPARPCAGCDGVAYCDEDHQRVDLRWHAAVCTCLRELAEDAEDAALVPDAAVTAEMLAVRCDGSDRSARAGGRDPARPAALLAAAPDWSDRPARAPDGDLPAARWRRMTDLATRPRTLAHARHRLRSSEEATPEKAGKTRVHVMAATRRERDVPAALWPADCEISLIGPELPADVASAAVRTHTGLYRRALWRELGRPDLVIGYHCGLLIYPTWKQTILELRGSGVPFILTSYRPWEAEGEARVLTAVGATCLFGPEPNPFASLASKRSATVANDVSHDNAWISAWR